MATEADLIQKFKDLDIPVGADFEELIHAAFAGSNLADLVNSKADDSKVVHTADMRKPASDVAGIDEVNTKQDKIGYTPADDSKVVHDNHDGTEQLNGVQVQPFNKLSDTIGGRNYLLNSATFNQGWNTNAQASAEIFELITETGVDNTVMHIKRPDTNVPIGLYQFPTHKFEVGEAITQSVMVRGHGQLYLSFDGATKVFMIDSDTYIKIYLPGIVTNTSGVFKLYANDIGEIWCYSPKVETGTIATDWTPAPEDKADDSKVPHLSGANNFDTTPTVNNNPLLLASSLPSDLARTSQQTNFTNGLQSGGVNVATAADLKSLADKAWHEVSLPDSTILKNAHFMYRSELIDAHYNTSFILAGKVIVPKSNSSTGVILLDLSSYLPISKADYKNYTVNSTLLGPDDKTFAGSDNSNFNPNYYINANSINVKLIDSNLVLYSSYGYAYFATATSAGAPISVSLSSDSTSLPTIDFVTSTKS